MIELLSRPKTTTAKGEFLDCMAIGEIALAYTPKQFIFERIRIHLELAKIALALKDKDYFERQMFCAFDHLDDLPLEAQFFAAVIWQVKARGNLRLYQDSRGALENIRFARKYVNQRYQSINLYLQDTELRALRMSHDPVLLERAKKIQARLAFEKSFLGNSYQDLNAKKKHLIGL